jgi:hypothetical protein
MRILLFVTSYVNSNGQMIDVFTKSLRPEGILYCTKLDECDIYTSLEESVEIC